MAKIPLLYFIVLALALAVTDAPAQTPNPLMPQIHPLPPGETVPPKPEQPAATPPPAPAKDKAPAAPAEVKGMPIISVSASKVELSTKGQQTYVLFNLAWSVDSTEPVAEVEGDLILSDDFGQARGRAPWTLKDPAGLQARFEERDQGMDVSTSGATDWFKGALPSWIHFGFHIRQVRFVSGKSLKAAGGDS